MLMLQVVASCSSFNGDGVIQQGVRKGLERKNIRRQVKNKTYPPPMGIRN